MVSNFKCDTPFTKQWYKFEGGAGTQMPDQVVPTYHCGTLAPGWLSGSHPTEAEGIVQRKVCFHWSGNPCFRYRYIRVRNCGGYYVYELGPTPSCYLRYCGNKDVGRDFFMFTLLFNERSFVSLGRRFELIKP